MAQLVVRAVQRHFPKDLSRVANAYNEWALSTCSSPRLLPTVIVNLADPAAAARQLERARGSGSRTFVFPLPDKEGRGLSHPTLETVWEAAADLGMLPVLHVGWGSVGLGPSWGRLGRGRSADSTAAFLGLSHLPGVAQAALVTLIAGGVFDVMLA